LKLELAACKAYISAIVSLSSAITSMQSHLSNLTTRYSKEFEKLNSMIAQMVPESMLTRCQEHLRSVAAERDHLVIMVGGMVPKIDLIKCQDMYKGAVEESARLQKVCSNMVPQSDLDSTKDEVKNLVMECERMRKLIQGMVPKPQMQAAQDDTAALRSELERLQSLIVGMVPRYYLDKSLEDVRTAKSLMLIVKTDALRLKAKCSADIQMLVSDLNELLDQRDTEIMMLSSEVERLSAILASDASSSLSRQQQARALIGPGRESSRPLSFLVPASGLARGQEGRLAPFMIQVAGHSFIHVETAVSILFNLCQIVD
jgi:hypothetical protein